MASVGDQLLKPEAGWVRDFCTNEIINYSAEWKTQSDSNWLSGVRKWSDKIGSKIKFSFIGTGIRLIGSTYSSAVLGTMKVTIDNNTETFNWIESASIQKGIVLYELNDLAHCIHSVEIEIINIPSGKYLCLDTIDMLGDIGIVPELSKDYEFPVKTIEKIDVEPYSASCINGEEQLLIAIEDGSQYLTRGDGTYIPCGVTKEKYDELEQRVLALEELLKQPQ